MVCLCFMTGCADASGEIRRAMALRDRLLSNGCSFDGEITADYGDKIHQFSVSCQADSQGNLEFSVLEPASIAGITGKVKDSGGTLTFDDKALCFSLLADGQITPVCAPWIFLKTLRGGYLTSAGVEGEGLRLSLDDSFEEDALHVDIWLDEEDIPIRGEMLYGGRRILSLDVKNFVMK